MYLVMVYQLLDMMFQYLMAQEELILVGSQAQVLHFQTQIRLDINYLEPPHLLMPHQLSLEYQTRQL